MIALPRLYAILDAGCFPDADAIFAAKGTWKGCRLDGASLGGFGAGLISIGFLLLFQTTSTEDLF